MKKYRYVEFVDGIMPLGIFAKHRGQLYIISDNPEVYVEEFSLVADKHSKYYSTTLERIGMLGWELVSVTPCGSFCFSEGRTNILYNAYVFKKEIEE